MSTSSNPNPIPFYAHPAHPAAMSTTDSTAIVHHPQVHSTPPLVPLVEPTTVRASHELVVPEVKTAVLVAVDDHAGGDADTLLAAVEPNRTRVPSTSSSSCTTDSNGSSGSSSAIVPDVEYQQPGRNNPAAGTPVGSAGSGYHSTSLPASSSGRRHSNSFTHENQPLLGGSLKIEMDMVVNNFPDDPDFQDVVAGVETAISNGIYPERIVQGTSGSYFAKNCEGVGNPSYEEKVLDSFFILDCGHKRKDNL
jgi:hypothetical protein